ncbi:MAG: dihydrofolate reductase [Hyphomicrobiaceae bacterium]|nr:dihydrofolate reductase [Hyphomicrobiaceae bacterium]
MTLRKIPMPSVTSIVARSYPDNIIGVDGQLPWHLRTDLLHFKRVTQNHAIIMGRKTYESLGRPLPNRMNIVLSQKEVPDAQSVRWARDPETALILADTHSILAGQKELFVIGGETIYKLFFKFINRVWLTEVFCGPLNGDAKFEQVFDSQEWYPVSERDYSPAENDDWPFRITCLNRRKPLHRMRSREEFLAVDPTVRSRLDSLFGASRVGAGMEKQPQATKQFPMEL